MKTFLYECFRKYLVCMQLTNLEGVRLDIAECMTEAGVAPVTGLLVDNKELSFLLTQFSFGLSTGSDRGVEIGLGCIF